jgi:ABC-type amino acid transport substrate-binding protein
MGIRHRLLSVSGAVVLLIGLAGCGLEVPSDPNGTLDAAVDGTLRVGASPDPTLVEVRGEEVSGAEVELVEAFASSIDARIDWTVGGEEQLVTGLEDGELDLVIGGITDQTPWVDHAGVSRSYPEMPGAAGRSIVVLVPLGENRFLSAVEAFLDEEVG